MTPLLVAVGLVAGVLFAWRVARGRRAARARALLGATAAQLEDGREVVAIPM